MNLASFNFKMAPNFGRIRSTRVYLFEWVHSGQCVFIELASSVASSFNLNSIKIMHALVSHKNIRN